MKIQIRKNIFETNSSSTHCLIITDEENKEKDLKSTIEEEKYFYPEYVSFHNELNSPKDKILMLAGLFDCENHRNNNLTKEYEIFIKILNDQNEIELLKQIKINRKLYLNDPDEPYCTEYYDNGCLICCNCNFCFKFTKYLKLNNLTEEEIYQKLKKFIYDNGIIIPYETI